MKKDVKFRKEANEEKIAFNYENCIVPISLYLHRGKMYQCFYPFCVKHYDKKFGTHLENDLDGIDIYNTTVEELSKKLKNPPVFCKNCTTTTGFVKCAQKSPERFDWENTDRNKYLLKDFSNYEFKITRKLVTYSILIIRDKRFNIINKTEDQLSGKTFSVLMRDENSKFHYDEYLVKSQNIWKIHISKIITLDELYSYNFSENENIILLRSKDKYNIKLIRNLLKKNYLHRTYLMI